MEKMTSDGPKIGPGGFVPTNPDLADILGRMDLDFENFYFSDFLDPKFLDFQVPRFPKSGPGQAWAGPGQVPRSRNSQISRFPDFQTPLAPAPDELFLCENAVFFLNCVCAFYVSV